MYKLFYYIVAYFEYFIRVAFTDTISQFSYLYFCMIIPFSLITFKKYIFSIYLIKCYPTLKKNLLITY